MTSAERPPQPQKMSPPVWAERRAERLVRCYPREWRARYGDEFVAMLTEDIRERPRSLARTLDVVRAGSLARLRQAGAGGDALSAERQLRAGLVTIAVTLAVFVTAAVALWSQLEIGWRWAAPSAHMTRSGMVLLSAALALFAALAVAAAAPLTWSVLRAVVRGEARRCGVPLAVAVGGAIVLIAGSIHFDHGWPGSGGHLGDGPLTVPVSVARVCWAATAWISSYWAHPGQLGAFPAIELVWMAVSPLAMMAIVVGGGKTLGRMPLSTRVMRYESWLGAAAGVAMVAALAGAGSWVLSGLTRTSGLYRAGVLDVIAITVMAAMLVLAFTAARRNVAVSTTTG